MALPETLCYEFSHCVLEAIDKRVNPRHPQRFAAHVNAERFQYFRKQISFRSLHIGSNTNSGRPKAICFSLEHKAAK